MNDDMKVLGRLRLKWEGGYIGPVREVTMAGSFIAAARDLAVSTIASSIRHEGVVALFDRKGKLVKSHVEAGVVWAGGRLWSTSAKRRVIELDPSGRHEVARYSAFGEAIVAIAVGANGGFVAARGAHQVCVYDTGTRKPVYSAMIAEPIRAAAFDEGERVAIAATAREVVIARWDGVTSRHGVAQVRSIARAGGGAFVVLSSDAVTRLDEGGVSSVATVADGRCLAWADGVVAVGTGQGRLELRDALTLTVSCSVELGQEIAAVTHHGEAGAWLVATGDDVQAVGPEAARSSLPLAQPGQVARVPRRIAAGRRRARWRPELDELRRTIADAPFLSRLGSVDRGRAGVVAEWPGPEDARAEALVAHLVATNEILGRGAPTTAVADADAIDRQVVERLALGPEEVEPWRWRRAYQTELVLVARALALCAARGADAPADLAELWSWLIAGHWPCAFASEVDLDDPEDRAELLVL